MKKFVIYPHSTVDLITNSSTEIFVANYGHTLKRVQDIIDHLVKIFYVSDLSGIRVEEAWDGYDKDYYGEDAIIISVDYYTIPPEMASLLESIFDSGERNEPGYLS